MFSNINFDDINDEELLDHVSDYAKSLSNEELESAISELQVISSVLDTTEESFLDEGEPVALKLLYVVFGSDIINQLLQIVNREKRSRGM